MQLVADNIELPIAQARHGDAAAWNTLFQRYQLPLFAYARSLVRDDQSALDVVQESFINAVRYLKSLRDDEKFAPWLFGIAHQKCIQHWRKHRPSDSLIDDEAEGFIAEGESPDDVLIRKEKEAAFMAMVDHLPVQHRTALLLHYLEDFSLEDISSITETTLGTVKSRLHYAKRALRKLLEDQL